MKINDQKLENVLLDLGHPDHIKGTRYIRIGVLLYQPDISMTKEFYPAIAEIAETTASRVERAMRHSIATAWLRGNTDAQQRYFGYTVNPARGVPTVGEYIARIARVCSEN